MKKNARKYLSFILTIAMILGCCNGFVMAVYADDEFVEEIVQEAFSEEPGEEPVEELENLQEEVSEEAQIFVETTELEVDAEEMEAEDEPKQVSAVNEEPFEEDEEAVAENKSAKTLQKAGGPVTLGASKKQPVNIRDAGYQVEISKSETEYTGTDICVTVSVYKETGVLIWAKKEYLNSNAYIIDGPLSGTDAGTYNITIKGNESEGYTGSISASWKISPKSLSKAEVDLSGPQLYENEDGSPQGPKVTVTLGEKTLQPDIDYTLQGNTYTKAGKYELKIVGTGNYKETIKRDWELGKLCNLYYTDSILIEDQPSFYKFTSTDSEVAAVETHDILKNAYIVAKAPGIAYITKTGKVSREETHYKVVVSELPLSEATVSFSPDRLIYNGEKQTVNVSVAYKGTELIEETDYTLTGTQSAVEAGQYELAIEGIGNCSGTVKPSWEIERRSVSEADVVLEYSEFSYDGTVKTVGAIKVFCDDKEIASDTDYSVSGTMSAVNAGVYKITITGNKNYCGEKTVEWEIKPHDISRDFEFSVLNTLVYDNGEEQGPTDVTVTSGGVTLRVGAAGSGEGDYAITGTTSASKPGHYEFSINGINNYCGTLPSDLTEWEIGTHLELDVGDYELIETLPTYYTFETDNPETATVEIHNYLKNAYIVAKAPGIAYIEKTGNYTGKVYHYEVEIGTIKSGMVSVSPNSLVYNGTEQGPSVVVNYKGTELVSGKDYTVEGSTAKDAGTYTVTVSGIRAHTGTVSSSWTIESCSISDASVSIQNSEMTYNGSLQTCGAVTVSLGGIVLTEGTDYSVAGSLGNSNCGCYKITITGQGNYSGSKEAEWTIKPCVIESADVAWGADCFEYNSNVDLYSIAPVVIVGGLTANAGIDFVISGTTSAEIGNHTAVISTKEGSNFAVSGGDMTHGWKVYKVVSVAKDSCVNLGAGSWRIADKANDAVSLETNNVTGLKLGMAKLAHTDNSVNDYDVIVKVLPQDYYTDEYFRLDKDKFVSDGTERTVKVMCITSDGIDSYTENIDYTVEGTLTASAVGTYYVTVSAITPDSGFEPLTLSWTISEAPQAPVYYSAPDPTINVPVSGEEGSTKISGTMSGTTLTVKDFNQGTEKEVLGEDVKTGMIKIEADKIGKTVTSVVMPQPVVQKIADAIEDENNDAEGFSVALSNATVEFDSQAALAIAKNVPEKDKLSLNVNTNSTLNNAQKIAIEGLDTEIVLDIYLTSNNQRITDFEGGAAKISIPYTLKDGQDPSGVSVWYVSETGEKEEIACKYVDGCVVFEVKHFSNYVVMWNTECPKDERCPLSEFTDLDPDADYHDGVHFCLTNEYMLGCGNGTFRPEDFETKAQLATVLYRIAQDEGRGFAGAWMFYPDCADAGSIPEYAYEGVCWLYMNGILEKDAEGSLNINESLTREEFVTVLYKFADFMGYDLGDYADSSLPAVEWADAEAILDDEKYKIEEALKVCRGEGASAVQAFLASCVR